MRFSALALCIFVTPVSVAFGQWSNAGAYTGRTSNVLTYGPDSPRLAWAFDSPSLIAGQPLSSSGTVVVARSAVPPEDEAGRPVIFALDVETGALIWSAPVPYREGDGPATTLAIASRVFVTRATSDHAAPIYELNTLTGAIDAVTAESIACDPRDGAIGHSGLVVGTVDRLHRLGFWSVPRTALPGGHTGATAGFGSQNAVILDAAPGGFIVRKLNLTDGSFLYQSDVFPAGTARYPIVSVFTARRHLIPVSSEDASASRLYALRDTGDALVLDWTAPIGYSLGGESAALSDGSLITVGPGNVLQRHAVLDGAVIARSTTIAEFPLRPVYAVDGRNVIYMSTGTGENGRLYAFDSGLHEHFPPVQHPGIGGIALDASTLFVSDTQGVYAYRNPPLPPSDCPSCLADYDGSGGVDGDDIPAFFADWQLGAPCADGDGSGGVDGDDVSFFFRRWERGSC